MMNIVKFDWARIVIRIVLGIIMFAHGLKKIKGFEKTIHHFHVDLGLPDFITYVVIFMEVIGGVLLIVGKFTRFAALGIVIIMLGAIYLVKWEKGFINGYEFDLALLAMAISLVIRACSTKQKT
jgi:putative oxidoreductase